MVLFMNHVHAGRELDALVAEKVMGFVLVPDGHCDECRSMSKQPIFQFQDGSYGPCDDYSTSIAAAWEVVEKLGYTWEMELHLILPFCSGYWCDLFLVVEKGCIIDKAHALKHVNAHADTAPLVICLAALEAVGYEPR